MFPGNFEVFVEICSLLILKDGLIGRNPSAFVIEKCREVPIDLAVKLVVTVCWVTGNRETQRSWHHGGLWGYMSDLLGMLGGCSLT